MNLLDIPENHIASKDEDEITFDFNFTIFTRENEVRFSVGDLTTSWMGLKDHFIDRIQFKNLNSCFLESHLKKEIEIKNILDDAIYLIDKGKYVKAISMLDEVLYYDPEYGEALFFKSRIFFSQNHFVKSLRHYKKAIKADDRLRDVEYHKLLLKKSSCEIDNFPKIKRNIYAGDEYFAKGDFKNALESYERALVNPTGFKTKILSKLLNKKATALLRLDRISEAIEVFHESISVKPNDYAYFHLGVYFEIRYLKKALKITKSQLLVKASKFHDYGEYDLALESLDEFLDNHYKVDDDYRYAMNLRTDVLKNLK